MHVRVRVAVNLLAARAFITAVNRRTVRRAADRVAAIQRFGQRVRERLQFGQFMAGKKVRVCDAPTLQAPLEQLDDLFLTWKIRKCHGDSYNRIIGMKSPTELNPGNIRFQTS
jgi:hypothetical protein